ncbi:MAG: hypothetical protein ACKVH0_20365 [Alphaproteobacteria bacterium]
MHLAPVRGARLGDERSHGARAEARRIDDAAIPNSSSRFIEDDVEILGHGGGRGRPVISVPSSAFFAQHIGQHPEARNAKEEASSAEVAYRDASDLGVMMDRPEPLALSI